MSGPSLPLLLAILVLTAGRATAQEGEAGHLILLGAGPADRGGIVGHLGWLARPSGRVPLGLRLDGMVGRSGDRRLGSLSAGVEVAPRLAALRNESASSGLFVHLVLGPVVTWSAGAGEVGGMIGIGTRLGLGAVTLAAEQRFQQGFSPLVVGLAIAP
jgi:hypothetical protein